MALVIDKQHPWRSSAFARIPVSTVSHSKVQRGRPEPTFEPEPATSVNSETTKTWLDEIDTSRLSTLAAQDAMKTGNLQVTTEIGSVKQGSADNAISYMNVLPYSYGANAGTQLHMAYSGKHIVVRPSLDETVVTAMYTAASADEWVKAAGIKLPRVTAQVHTDSSPLARRPQGRATTSTGYEGLRRCLATCARQDDYGDRLFNMARVVCHAEVLATLGCASEVTSAMLPEKNSCDSVFTADCPSLTQNDIDENVFLYTFTDESDDYRAFLTMGVRGVQNYAGSRDTIYSNTRVEAEAKQGDNIVFVRVSGQHRETWAPPVEAYLRTLNNPTSCLAYYYAYARSMGLGHIATAILCQAAIGPHIWLADAITPYKNCRPKLDAATYTILPTADKADLALTSATAIVNNAAVIASSIKAGLGALMMGFSAGKDIDAGAVISQVMQRLSDPEMRRSIVHSVTSRYRNGSVGLEWLSPFSYDVHEGVVDCIRAWRTYGYMIADFNKCPLNSLKECLSTGVDMTNSLIGRHTVVKERGYAQLIMCSMAAGAELPGLCELPTVGHLASVQATATRLREWQPVISIVSMTGIQTPENAHRKTPTPDQAAKGTKMFEGSATTRSRRSETSVESPVKALSRSKFSKPMTKEPVDAPTSLGASTAVPMTEVQTSMQSSSSGRDEVVRVTHLNRPPVRHIPAVQSSSSSSAPASKHRRVMSGSAPKPFQIALPPAATSKPNWPDSVMNPSDDEAEESESEAGDDAPTSQPTAKSDPTVSRMKSPEIERQALIPDTASSVSEGNGRPVTAWPSYGSNEPREQQVAARKPQLTSSNSQQAASARGSLAVTTPLPSPAPPKPKPQTQQQLARAPARSTPLNVAPLGQSRKQLAKPPRDDDSEGSSLSSGAGTVRKAADDMQL